MRLPREFAPVPAGSETVCAGGVSLVADHARLELGRRPAVAPFASERQLGHDAARRSLQDERQKLRRWTGNLARAERAAREWVRSASRG